MKTGVLVALTFVIAVSGFALIFCRNEDAETSSVKNSKAKAGPGGSVASDAAPPGPMDRALPKFPAPRPAVRTPEQEAAEKAWLKRIAPAIAVYEQALAANDPMAVASRDFLAANARRAGVATTSSGLQYEILTAGTQPAPAATDTVKVHYHGTLPDGTVFDSSVERGEPISFPLNGVIAGWTEGLQLMPTGSKFKLFIPSYLAYGAQGTAPKIPSHAALVFEVELLGIEQK